MVNNVIYSLAMLLIVLLSGCGVVRKIPLMDPTVRPASDSLKAYDDEPSLPNAVKVANSLRDRYREKVSDQQVLIRSVGLLLIPAGAAAVGLGTTSTAGNAVLGLGLAGASSYIATTFLTSKLEQFIYAAGREAVTCALDAIHPLRVTYGDLDELRKLMRGNGAASYEALISKVEDLIRAFGANRTVLTVQAEAAVRKARNMLQRAKEAEAALEQSGGELMTALEGIQHSVDQAIINNSSNLQALVETLGASLPSLSARITGRALAIDQTPTGAASAEETRVLKTALGELTERTFQIGLTVDKVAAKPSAEKLANCKVDLAGTGITMKIIPEGEVTLDATRTGASATLKVDGGVLPYRVRWVGQNPGSGVGLNVESGLGIVTITADKGIPSSIYTILVQDAAQGRETVIVRMSGATGGSQRVSTGSGQRADPEIKRLQEQLIAEGITEVVVDGKTQNLVADGLWGKRTAAAIKRYLMEKQQMAEADIPSEKEALLKDAKSLLGP